MKSEYRKKLHSLILSFATAAAATSRDDINVVAEVNAANLLAGISQFLDLPTYQVLINSWGEARTLDNQDDRQNLMAKSVVKVLKRVFKEMPAEDC
jgi:hypothetical protein